PRCPPPPVLSSPCMACSSASLRGFRTPVPAAAPAPSSGRGDVERHFPIPRPTLLWQTWAAPSPVAFRRHRYLSVLLPAVLPWNRFSYAVLPLTAPAIFDPLR